MTEKKAAEIDGNGDDISPVLDDTMHPQQAIHRAFIGGRGDDTDYYRTGAGAKTYDGEPEYFHV